MAASSVPVNRYVESPSVTLTSEHPDTSTAKPAAKRHNEICLTAHPATSPCAGASAYSMPHQAQRCFTTEILEVGPVLEGEWICPAQSSCTGWFRILG